MEWGKSCITIKQNIEHFKESRSSECSSQWPVTWNDSFHYILVSDNVRFDMCEVRCQCQLADHCTHRADTKSHKDCITKGQAVRSVQSKLAVCLDGRAQIHYLIGGGLTACDSHFNSSISSLTNHSGQTVHRNNPLPILQQSNTCSPDILPVLRTTRCSVHDQTNCSICVKALVRSLVLGPHRKSFCSNTSNVQPFDELLLLSASSRPQCFLCRINGVKNQPNLSLCESTNDKIPSYSSASLLEMYQTSYTSQTQHGKTTGPCLSSVHSINSDSFLPIANRLCRVDKSMSISEQDNNETQEDLNSICKYLPTSDRSDLGQRTASCRSETDSPSVHSSEHQQSGNIWLDVGQTESTRTRYRISSVPNTCRAQFLVWPLKASYVQFLFVALLFCQWQSSVHSSANIRAIEKRILDSIIGDGRYDSRIRPMGNASVGARGGDGPAMVYVNLLIRSISRIDDVVMEYSVQVTFREQWVDNRLKFDNMNGQIRYLVLTDPNRVWRPDLFFKNEKEGHFHEIIMPNVLLRIYPEGGVLYSIRISLVLACPMNLKYYPLDKQICSIQMASYGYTTEDLMFIWKNEDPVQINTNLHLPRFTLEKYLTDYCTSKTNTGSYSCLKVDLLFKREFSYYLIQIYIPCCMLVIVSWVSFWLDPNAIPARVSLGVTTLLTMATSISGINSSLPPVSYTKAIDVWTGVCLTFVFGALLEFALVNYASRSDAHRAALKQQQAAFAAQRKWDLEHAAALEADHIDDRSASAFAMRPLVRQHGDFHGEKMRACEIHVSLPKRNWCKRWLSKFPTRSKRIDVISRIFFPLMFALFNLVYWTTYLFREDMQDL